MLQYKYVETCWRKMTKIKTNITKYLFITGRVIFVIGFCASFFKAGLLYQEPTPENAREWMLYYNIGKVTMPIGFWLVLISLILKLLYHLKKKIFISNLTLTVAENRLHLYLHFAIKGFLTLPKGENMILKRILLPLLSILIVAMSWFMNFGFLRLFCSIILIPLAHAVIVFAVCVAASNYSNHKLIKLYKLLFCLTYILSNVFLPDSGGSSMRVFFGLIDNYYVCEAGEGISLFAFIAHVVLLVLLMLEICRINKNENNNWCWKDNYD